MVRRNKITRLSKSTRVLMMLHDLLDGEEFARDEIEKKYRIDRRQFERDIQTIRLALAEQIPYQKDIELLYDRKRKVYCLSNIVNRYFTNAELLSILKILLESRAFCENEKERLVTVLLNQVNPREYVSVKNLIRNESHLYKPLKHNKELFNLIWDLSQAVNQQRNLKIKYQKADNAIVERLVSPVGIIFSEYYFYLMCYFPKKKTNDAIPYRIDRIHSYEILNEKYKVFDEERFQEGEHRKQVHWMYQGELLDCCFEFSGHSIEAVLDRFPDSKIKEQKDNKYIVTLKAKEKGLIMWLLSQGSGVKVLSPQSLVDKMQDELKKMLSAYTGK